MSSQAKLKEDISSNSFKNVYIFYGKENYLIDYYIGEMKKKLLDDNTALLNFTKINNEKELYKLIDVCEAMPVFAEKKLVILDSLDIFNSKKKEKKEYVNYLSDIPDYVCLIVCERDKTLSKQKKLEQNPNILYVEFKQEDEEKLVKWVMAILKNSGKNITKPLASKIVEMCGPHMSDIKGELDKLILFEPNNVEITDKMIESICEKNISSLIFDMMNAIARKDAKGAYRYFEEMLELKNSVQNIFATLSATLRQLILVREMIDKKNTRAISSTLGVSSGRAYMLEKDAKKFSYSELAEALTLAGEGDVNVRNGIIGAEIALETVIAKMLG